MNDCTFGKTTAQTIFLTARKFRTVNYRLPTGNGDLTEKYPAKLQPMCSSNFITETGKINAKNAFMQ
jgi:hypothetical protein